VERRQKTQGDPWKSLIRLLRYRPRSVAEARKRLRSLRFSDTQIDKTISKAQSLGLLDDEAFAKVWIEDRLLSHPLSRRAIMQELTDKGIDRVLAGNTLNVLYPAASEREVAIKLAGNRLSRYANLDTTTRTQRTISFLARRGFDFFLARSAVEAAEKEPSKDTANDSN